MLTVQEIKKFIDADTASAKKKNAKIGDEYYNAEHDIKNYRVFYVDANGELKEDETKSNIKICHPFFTENVDQTVQYLLSGEDKYIRSDTPELQTKLDEYFNENEDFMAEFYDVLTGCVSKGFENMYAYKDENERTAFACADSLGVVEVKEKDTEDHCEYVIRHFADGFNKDNKIIRRIEVWDAAQTYYYCQEGNGDIVLDTSVTHNPRPHTIYKQDGDENTYFEGYGFIPFFRLDNNKKQVSGLKPIKDLIDDYDLMACGLSNNIQDTNEALYVVKGFEGDNLDELHMNLRVKKHVGVGEDGDVDIKTIDIPVEARETKMRLDKENIYHFGMAVDTAGLKDSGATVSVAVKSAYANLGMKCYRLKIRVKQFLRKLLKVVLAEINEVEGTDYQQKDVYFVFNPEIPTNALENAQIELTDAQRKQVEINTLLNLAARLDNETLMQLICEQLDIDYDEIKDKLPDPETNDPYQAKTALGGVVPEDDPVEPGGGGIVE